jgi:hypothetical protein
MIAAFAAALVLSQAPTSPQGRSRTAIPPEIGAYDRVFAMSEPLDQKQMDILIQVLEKDHKGMGMLFWHPYRLAPGQPEFEGLQIKTSDVPRALKAVRRIRKKLTHVRIIKSNQDYLISKQSKT